MWAADKEFLDAGRTCKISISRESKRLGYEEILALWRSDESFREFFISLLADCPFSAYFWETPPVTRATIGRDFEFVLVESRQLATVAANPAAFEGYFRSQESREGVVTFWNLGRDALLVVPCPVGPVATYAHLASFAREAPRLQQHALWRSVAEMLTRRLGDRPVWLSTAGLGVYWLHVRLDTYPKYYSFDPYREAP